MMNQVVAGPETYSYYLTYYLYLSQGPGYDEPGGGRTRNLLLPPSTIVPGGGQNRAQAKVSVSHIIQVRQISRNETPKMQGGGSKMIYY
jgi:hypothetical protein